MATNPSQRPLNFIDAFALLLIGFKLAHVGDVADLSWWWVLSPWWISLVWSVLFAFLGELAKGIAAKRAASKRNRRRPSSKLRREDFK